jgi:hypothetical protein
MRNLDTAIKKDNYANCTFGNICIIFIVAYLKQNLYTSKILIYGFSMMKKSFGKTDFKSTRNSKELVTLEEKHSYFRAVISFSIWKIQNA